MKRPVALFVGFVIGAVLGFGLCYLVLSFEFVGGPSSGMKVFVFGAHVCTPYGILVDLVPATVYVLLCGLTGIAGAIISARMARKT